MCFARTYAFCKMDLNYSRAKRATKKYSLSEMSKIMRALSDHCDRNKGMNCICVCEALRVLLLACGARSYRRIHAYLCCKLNIYHVGNNMQLHVKAAITQFEEIKKNYEQLLGGDLPPMPIIPSGTPFSPSPPEVQPEPCPSPPIRVADSLSPRAKQDKEHSCFTPTQTNEEYGEAPTQLVTHTPNTQRARTLPPPKTPASVRATPTAVPFYYKVCNAHCSSFPLLFFVLPLQCIYLEIAVE